MKNIDIRSVAKSAGVRLWQVADYVGISESTFFRSLRRELPECEKKRIRLAIQAIAEAVREEPHNE